MGRLPFQPNWGRSPNTTAAALYHNRHRHRSMAIRVTVPNLVGLTEENAILAIRNAGLTLDRVILTTGVVASQYPVASAEAIPYSMVTVTLTS